MNIKWQTIILIGLILFSGILIHSFFSPISISSEERPSLKTPSSSSSFVFDFQKNNELNSSFQNQSLLQRDWSVLDPEIKAKAVLVESLDYHLPLFHKNISESWPIASLTKLFTASVFLENSRVDEKVEITPQAVQTEGDAGGLKAGEIYNNRDLLKIMILTSSNDAAVALAQHFNQNNNFSPGTDFISLLNQKAKEIKMTATRFEDPSGLSPGNYSNASDLALMTEYILNNHPEIFTWSRLPNILVEPLNKPSIKKIFNINPLINDPDFLGGKTGTNDESGGNLIALFSLKNDRILIIILGSEADRFQQAKEILKWAEKAYYSNK